MKNLFSFIVANLIFCHLCAQVNSPVPGTAKKILIKVFRIEFDPRKTTRVNHIYTTPIGWQILSYRPLVTSNNIRARCQFSLTAATPSNGSTSAIYSKFIELSELAAEKNVSVKYEGIINQMRDDFEKYYNKNVTTYSKITSACAFTSATVKKNKTRRTERLYLDVEITLIFLPQTEEQILQCLENLKQLIQTEE